MQNIKNINRKQNPGDKFVVLLAEEHPLTSRIQQKSIEEGGFQVIIVKIKEEIIHIVKNQKIDLLMIDINFNKKEGLGFISKIKSLSLNKKIKIILTSVVAEKNNIKSTIKNKIDHFIIKPMPKGRLIEELKDLTAQTTRKFERFALELDACILIGGKSLHSKVIDLSDAGIHLEDPKHKFKVELGSVLEIDIALPIYKHPIHLTGTLVRITKEGFGLRILSITKENRRRLGNFMRKYSASLHSETYYL